jgi:phosphatidylserine/phosphatidylglycerophosphate/cardiolipin synthase-like enzyme
MIDALLGLPLHLRERLATALEAGVLSSKSSAAALQAQLGGGEFVGQAAAVLGELERLAVPAPAGAEWIRSVDKAELRVPRLDLVWSGPEVVGLHARDTRRVYEEVVGAARHALWVSTYAFFDGPRAFEQLALRMDATPGLHVTLLLNLQRKRGDTSSADQLVRRFADRFWSLEWPGKSKPRVYFDPRALEADGPEGVLHAKAVVADDEAVFVTSANLTEAAFDRNIELGLLVRDRTLALTITSHFQALIDRELLQPLPSN